MNKLNISRALVVLGLALALLSVEATLSHILNPDYLITDVARGANHAWYHFFREAAADIASMVVLLLLLFGPAKYRSPATWWTMTIVALGWFAPYWIGYPWHGVSAPSVGVEVVHVLQAVLTFLGLFLVKEYYFSTADE